MWPYMRSCKHGGGGRPTQVSYEDDDMLYSQHILQLNRQHYGNGVGGLRPGPHCSLNSTSPHRDVLLLTYILIDSTC